METLTALLIVMFAATPLASARPDAHASARIEAAARAPATPIAGEAATQRDRAEACRKAGTYTSSISRDDSVTGCASTTLHGKFDAARGRLKNCSKQASERKLKGYQRVDFMASCLHV